MDSIDLDAIIFDNLKDNSPSTVRECMKDAIHQALVLASEKASAYIDGQIGDFTASVNKQSILDVEKLVK